MGETCGWMLVNEKCEMDACGWMKCVDEIFGCVWMRMGKKCGCNYKTKLHYGFLSDKPGLRARVRNCTSFSEQNEMQCRKNGA